MKLIILGVLIFLLIICTKSQITLKTVSDDDLVEIVQKEAYVIALFITKNTCSKCDGFKNALNEIQKQLIQNFGDQTVQLYNSQLTRIYSPANEPALVFFRHGIPLLYHGEPDPEEILHTFLNNKEPSVKELTDESFEHLTQAATGATTGDWFLMFYTPDCVDCHRLVARWEAVASQLKSKMNVARINKAVEGAATANRFQVTKVPSFILFKQGKLYRYHNQKYDVASFLSFVKDWYKNMKPERVPLPKTPFDELIEKIANNLYENTWIWKISALITLSALLLLLLIKYKKVTSEQRYKKKNETKTK